MGNIPSRRLALLGLVGLVAFASPGPTAAVFCIADNGHAAIEVLASPCCEDGAAPVGPAVTLAPSDVDHRNADCGPCVDLQLTSPSNLKTPAQAAAPGNDTPTLRAAAPTACAPSRTSTRPGDDVPAPPFSRELLASVVLLI
jgi:hypothetical protein